MYILDTNIIRKLVSHFPKRGKSFEAIWEIINEKIEQGELISVDECFNELSKQLSDKSDVFIWIKDRKSMFKNPNNEESLIISKLLVNKKMRENLRKKNILENRPCADIYIAAKAKAQNAIVVTAEEYKPNSSQLPNICEELGVRCIGFDDFMEYIDS